MVYMRRRRAGMVLRLAVEYEAHEEDGLVVFLARIAVVVAHVKQMRTITA